MTILNKTVVSHYGHNDIVLTVPIGEIEGVSNKELLPLVAKALGISAFCLSIKERGVSRSSQKAFVFIFDDKMN